MTTESPAATTDTTQGGTQAVAEGTPPAGAAQTAATTPAVEQKADETKAPEAEITYDFKMPDGVKPDEKTLADFTKFAKELKLSPEAAQKLVDLRSTAVKEAQDQHTATVKGWADEVKADKELGGDKLPDTLAIAKKAIDLGPPELKGLLESSGLGNHPAVVKWAHTIGKALSEDTFKAAANVGATKVSTASVLYGGTPQKN